MGLSGPAIRIGALYALSGAAAAYGASARQGLELAVERFIEDEQSPIHAVETVRRMARERGICLFIGIDSSAVGYFSWSYFSRFLRELKPEAELVPEGIFHPPGAEDLTPWIQRAMRLGGGGALDLLLGRRSGAPDPTGEDHGAVSALRRLHGAGSCPGGVGGPGR